MPNTNGMAGSSWLVTSPLRDVDPDHVGGVGALEVVAAAGQVLHGPEDRAGDVRSVRVAQAGGDRNVSDVPWPGNSPQQRIRI